MTTTTESSVWKLVAIPRPVDKNYYWHMIYFNTSQSKTKTVQDSNESSPIDESVSATVNIIGLLVALVVSAVIIVGVAVVIRKLRKLQNESQNDDDTEETKHDMAIQTVTTSPQIHNEPPQTFTLTFTEVPIKDDRLLARWIPKQFRPKRKSVDIDKLRRELGQIYVY